MRLRPLLLALPLAAALAAGPAAPRASAGLDAAWRAIPSRMPVDSVALLLRAMEVRGAAGVRPGEAAYALGQLRYARGEYVQAADAFLRAHARLDGDDRQEARYAYALAALALGNTPVARIAFAEVAAAWPPRRPLALLGVAQCWDAERRPEKAFDALRTLLAEPPGEAGPAALERFAALALQFHREADARGARTRLAREYRGSIEAARVAETPPARPGLVSTGPAPRLPAP